MSKRNLYLGMNVHKESVVGAVLPEGAAEPTDVRRLPNHPRKLRRYFERVGREGRIRARYEGSSAGYVLQRQMTEWGNECEIVAPSLIPTRPADRRKHDRKDATQLAHLYRADELVTIRVLTESEERVWDLVRCRETFQREILKSRHYVLKFLWGWGFVYRERPNWTEKHHRWLRRLVREEALSSEDGTVLKKYLALLDYKLARRADLDRRIEELAFSDAYREAVGRLRCFRGIDMHTVMVLLTELGDFRRFESARQLMADVGLVPTGHSSGELHRWGSITKAGNSRCRHVLVQATWSYRPLTRVGRVLKRRQEGQPPGVITHSSKAKHRSTSLRRLAGRRIHQMAVVACARELVGFV